jgi:hypothetical protein
VVEQIKDMSEGALQAWAERDDEKLQGAYPNLDARFQSAARMIDELERTTKPGLKRLFKTLGIGD